jgi:hypothetical protein
MNAMVLPLPLPSPHYLFLAPFVCVASLYGSITLSNSTVNIQTTYSFDLFRDTSSTIPAGSVITITFPSDYPTSYLPASPACTGVKSLLSSSRQ